MLRTRSVKRYLVTALQGFFFSRPYKTSVLGAGDQQIPFVLPTDLFDHSFYFLGRGASLTRNVGDSRLFVFVGTTTDGYFAPFLSVARNDTASGAIFYEKQLSPALRFFSRNVFSNRQTSIQALDWTARKDIKLALSAGMGNNQPYGSSSFAMQERWVGLDASYTLSGRNFQRVLVATPQLAENDRENIRLELRPASSVRIILSRNNYLASFVPNQSERATVQGFGASAAAGGFQLNGSYFLSATTAGNATAMDLGVHRHLTRRLEVGGDYLRSVYMKGAVAHSMIGNVREIFSSRLNLTQIISHTSQQTTVDFGGNFVSNFVTLSVDYQTLFLPFAQSAPGQLKQVMVVGLHFQLPNGVSATDTGKEP